jgi:hypothetical protein
MKLAVIQEFNPTLPMASVHEKLPISWLGELSHSIASAIAAGFAATIVA